MKIAGIIGGTGPESTIDYYRLIVSSYRERKGDGSYPPLFISSIDNQKMLALIAANDLAATAEYLLGEVNRLARAGAAFGLFAANTPHIVFDDVRDLSPIPLLSIVEATCDEAKRLGLRRVGLFGTRFTMQGSFYPGVFAREGIELIVPTLAEQTLVHHRYMDELLRGVFLPGTRASLLEIAQRLRTEERIEGLILGGTELPLLLRGGPAQGIPFLDTTKIHVECVVTEMLSSSTDSTP